MDPPAAAPDDETPRKRRRAKVACNSCRERKRKCDGGHPCGQCLEFEYECGYGPSTARQARSENNSILESRTASPRDAARAPYFSTSRNGFADESRTIIGPNTERAQIQSMEANSGAAFVRNLGLNIDAKNAPRLRLFAWNVGERLAGSRPGTVRPLPSMLSHAEMNTLAHTFFTKVAVVYDFLDHCNFFERLDRRFHSGAESDPFDQVLCGIAALGLHFTQTSPPYFEPDLVETARTILEQGSLVSPPSTDTVTGWILRVAYLRMTSTPHICWLATCSLMHVAEAAGIHQEAQAQTVFEQTPTDTIGTDIRRRMWGHALHFNIWTSFDLGRTKVTLPNATTKPVEAIPGDYTSQLLALLPLTERLDPNQSRSAEDLEADLSFLLSRQFDEPPMTMANTNLALCIFRRLYALKPGLIQPHIEGLLRMAKHGLQAARSMVTNYLPWHHAANMPFQIICALLALDNRASLGLLREGLSVLRAVRDKWDSPSLREAYDTAYLLVLLHQRRKEEDARELRGVLDTHAPPVENTQVPASGEDAWLDDLFTTVPGLKEFDLEQFLVDTPFNVQDLGQFGG